MDFSNEYELRAFLRICIEPGERRDKRTPVRLAAAMPAPVLDALAEYAPHVDAIRKATDADAQRAEESRSVYAAALLAWIRDEQPTRHVRGLVERAEEHVTACVACTQNGVISHRCPDGRRLVASFLAPSPDVEEAACRHESWEVTSEYAEGEQWKTWVQSRRCTDCRESLPEIRQAEPHFPQQRDGEAAAALGHASVEVTAAYAKGVEKPSADDPNAQALTDYSEAIRANGLVPVDGSLVEATLSGGAVHAAFHVSVAPGLELDWRVREEITRLIRANLAVREQ